MNQVMSWNGKGIGAAEQTHWVDKGERECVRVTLQDGRIVECTPEHPMMTSKEEWKQAHELLEQRVNVGVKHPCVSIKEEIEECAGWQLDLGWFILTTTTPKEFFKTMAFARLLGLLVTDGHYPQHGKASVFAESMYDVERILDDLRLFTEITQTKFKNANSNSYTVYLPMQFTNLLEDLKGLTIGNKVYQSGTGIPTFIMDAPRPIVREFLGGMFGGDGHTCVLATHRGKRDILTSIDYSRTKKHPHIPSLREMMESVRTLLNKCGINKITLQQPKEISDSKRKTGLAQEERSYEMVLHLELEEIIPFYEKVGFRYCAQKSQRLEAGAAYRRLREGVTRQHNWIVDRVDAITNYREVKSKDPTQKIQTKKAIQQATDELRAREPILHDYVIPSTHDIADHLLKGTEFGKFTSKSFPTAEQFFEEIGVLSWFDNGFAITSDNLPTMSLKVIDIRPIGSHQVYDIQVDGTHNFLANGVVSHNCLISQGCSRFLLERLYDLSDPYKVPVCAQCGSMPSTPTYCSVCDQSDIKTVPLPYAAKLLFQELNAMGIRTNLIPKE